MNNIFYIYIFYKLITYCFGQLKNCNLLNTIQTRIFFIVKVENKILLLDGFNKYNMSYAF